MIQQKRAHDSHIARAKEILKLGPAKDKDQASNNGLKVYVRAVLTHRRAIKEEIIAINRDWVYNQACRLSHDIHVVSHSYITFNYLFKLITKIRLSNNSFKFMS